MAGSWSLYFERAKTEKTLAQLVFRFIEINHMLQPSFFFLKHPAPPEFYPLPLPAALPIYRVCVLAAAAARLDRRPAGADGHRFDRRFRADLSSDGADQGRRAQERTLHRHRQRSRVQPRSEEHTSELQSQSNLVCRLLLEKK